MHLQLEHCSIRPLEITDIASLAKHGNTRAVWLNTNLPSPFTPEIAHEVVAPQLESGDKVFFAVEVGDQVIGVILLKLQSGPKSHSAEIGYWIGEQYWGRGIGTEIVDAVTNYGFEALKLVRISAYVFEWNPASMRVLEKCGYYPEGWLRKSVQKDGQIIDQAVYGKLCVGNQTPTPRRKILVVPYNPEWPAIFDRLKARVKPHLADTAVSIEHVGSTSVPGLAAKPVIDMFVVVRTDASKAIQGLAEVGYAHEGNLGIVGREAFKHSPDLPRHHLYVVIDGNEPHRSSIAFRDYLRDHPEARDTYEVIKRGAAEMFPNDIDRYIALKGPFVRGIVSMVSNPRR